MGRPPSTTTRAVAATVRIGTCSWADKGLLEAWYPRGVSTAEKRLRYYAERFDVVEVDSPYYALPDPAVTERWARRTPDEFTFHVKASAAMTWHEGEPTDEAFRLFRAALEPLELSGKMQGVLLQYHPRFTKTAEAKAELARAPERLAPLVPLIEFRHRSWMEEAERADTLAFLEANGLAYVSLDSPTHPGLERLAARGRGDAPRGVRSVPRTQRGDVEHPRSRERGGALRLALQRGRARGVGRAARATGERGRGGLRALQQQPRRLRPPERPAPAGLLDEAGVPAAAASSPRRPS